jgi:hypothetical protein
MRLGPLDNGNRRRPKEPRRSQRTRLIYQLMRVEHHDDEDERSRIAISDTWLEVDLALLRELNSGLDAGLVPNVALCEDGAGIDDIPEAAAERTRTEGFHPGLKVRIVLDGGGEKEGVVRWSRNNLAGWLLPAA